jgi:hypothetical protein
MAVMADSKHGRYHFLVFSTLCCIIAIGPPPDPLTAWADRVDIAAVLFIPANGPCMPCREPHDPNLGALKAPLPFVRRREEPPLTSCPQGQTPCLPPSSSTPHVHTAWSFLGDKKMQQSMVDEARRQRGRQWSTDYEI